MRKTIHDAKYLILLEASHVMGYFGEEEKEDALVRLKVHKKESPEFKWSMVEVIG